MATHCSVCVSPHPFAANFVSSALASMVHSGQQTQASMLPPRSQTIQIEFHAHDSLSVGIKSSTNRRVGVADLNSAIALAGQYDHSKASLPNQTFSFSSRALRLNSLPALSASSHLRPACSEAMSLPHVRRFVRDMLTEKDRINFLFAFSEDGDTVEEDELYLARLNTLLDCTELLVRENLNVRPRRAFLELRTNFQKRLKSKPLLIRRAPENPPQAFNFFEGRDVAPLINKLRDQIEEYCDAIVLRNQVAMRLAIQITAIVGAEVGGIMWLNRLYRVGSLATRGWASDGANAYSQTMPPDWYRTPRYFDHRDRPVYPMSPDECWQALAGVLSVFTFTATVFTSLAQAIELEMAISEERRTRSKLEKRIFFVL